MIQPFNLFNAFVPALLRGKHNLESDTLTLYLSKNAPSPNASTLSEITATDAKNLSSRTLKSKLDGNALHIDPITLIAKGDVGPFQYLIVGNGINLVGWMDRGKLQTLNAGDEIALNFGDKTFEIGDK